VVTRGRFFLALPLAYRHTPERLLEHENQTDRIVGASGYSGEELVRLLLSHPHAELSAVTSRQYAGQTLAQVFPKSPITRAPGSCISASRTPSCWPNGRKSSFWLCRTVSPPNSRRPCFGSVARSLI